MKLKHIMGLAWLTGALALTSATPALATSSLCTHPKSGSHIYRVCINGEVLGLSKTESVPYTSKLKSGTSVSLNGAGEPFYSDTEPVSCSTLKTSGELQSGERKAGLSNVERAWGSCHEVNEPYAKECSVSFGSNALTAGYKTGEFLYTGSGKLFGSLEVRGCELSTAILPIHTAEPTNGVASCQATGIGAEAAQHEIACEESKSELTIKGSQVKVGFTEVVELAGADKGKSFSIVEAAE